MNMALYYKDLTETKNFEALRVTPNILDLFARNFKNDPKSFWLSLGLIFDIFERVEKVKIKKIEIYEICALLSDNVKNAAMEGVKNGSFFDTFHLKLIHIYCVTLLADIMKNDSILFLYYYLSNSSNKIESFAVVHNILSKLIFESADFIFAVVAAEIFLKAIENDNISTELKNIAFNLEFMTNNRLVPKTYILIMSSLLDSY